MRNCTGFLSLLEFSRYSHVQWSIQHLYSIRQELCFALQYGMKTTWTLIHSMHKSMYKLASVLLPTLHFQQPLTYLGT